MLRLFMCIVLLVCVACMALAATIGFARSSARSRHERKVADSEMQAMMRQIDEDMLRSELSRFRAEERRFAESEKDYFVQTGLDEWESAEDGSRTIRLEHGDAFFRQGGKTVCTDRLLMPCSGDPGIHAKMALMSLASEWFRESGRLMMIDGLNWDAGEAGRAVTERL